MNSKYADINKTVPFDTIDIGHMFYAHDKIWVRISYDAAKCLSAPDGTNYGVCNFMLEGTGENEPEQVFYINTDEVAEWLLELISQLKQENKMKH